ncbi:branched-chain amino acid ABC transporter permease [Neoroseomonas soli]|uniref:Branched-chain amino acid ABC transporter permease n=1 Tax=Neoroseomonas soli TaxID=1081025 RepID=A0A9X9WR37_9PROT|nr:branched-chain amino acid ABC transporter permease [Neoroseomonas soli]MBR0669616.1 branched-chain amino acid ABC transporter permease [Neoroseomonas soli]
MIARLLIFAAAAALVALPFFAPSHIVFLVAMIGSTSVMVAGLTIVVGFTGQISIAQASFAAIGAYGTAQLATMAGLPHWIGLPAIALVAAVVGYLFGLLSLRVADHYLALATMALCAIVQLLLIHLEDWTGGAVGLAVPPLAVGTRMLTRPTELYAVIMPCVALTVWFLHALSTSRLGRAFAALRMSEVAAAAIGIPVLHYKSLAFALSAFFGAFGGGLFALQTTYLDPAQFGILESVRLIAIAVIGGVLNPFGPLIGSAVFVLLPEAMGALGRYMSLVFSLLLLLFVVVSPQGIAGLPARLRARR